ncbi:hypothetical protein, partial [Enterobacter hormaechei]
CLANGVVAGGGVAVLRAKNKTKRFLGNPNPPPPTPKPVRKKKQLKQSFNICQNFSSFFFGLI